MPEHTSPHWLLITLGALTVCAAFLGGIGAMNNPVIAQDGAPSVAPTQVRVIWEREPHRRATISWTTTLPGSSHRLLLAETSQAGAAQPAWSIEVEQVKSGKIDEELEVYYHHAVVDTLLPSTRYYFQVESDAQPSQEGWFITAPADDRRVKLLYGGDSRSDWEDRQGMNRRMALLLEEDEEILALWHGGDFVSDGGEWGDWDQWLTDHALTTTAQGRVMPVIPTRGNHERDGEMYNRVFGWPGGEDREQNYFVTKMGQWATLVTLDSEASVLGDQRDWLEATLLSNQDARWLVAGYHTPAWPAVKIPGPALAWVPYFERYSVDMVCENDGHALKRTVPILGDKMDPAGVVYVGEGGLGVKQREPNPEHWYLQSPGQTMSAHHVQVLTFEEDRLGYEAIGMDGALLDTYERSPRERMLAPFKVERSSSFDERGYYLRFNRGLDRDTIAPDKISASPELPIEDFKLAADRSLAKLYFAQAPVPGATYTLDLSALRDPAGNPLASPTYELVVDAAEVADMGGMPDMREVDMAPDAPDMRQGEEPREEDMGGTPMPDMASAPPEDQEEDDGGCSSSGQGTPALPGPLAALLLGLFWRERSRGRSAR